MGINRWYIGIAYAVAIETFKNEVHLDFDP